MKRVFGYGSLVNRKTHDFPCVKSSLTGWERVWVSLPGRPFAILSARRAEVTIEGLMLEVPLAGQPDLDSREAEYDCVSLPGGSFVYSIPAANTVGRPTPILRSYLDVVFQGFDAEFGPESLNGFLETTADWDRGIYDDRAAPIYPRAQVLTTDQSARYDAMLASVPVVEEL